MISKTPPMIYIICLSFPRNFFSPKAISRSGNRKAAYPRNIIIQPEKYAPINPPKFRIGSGGSVARKKSTGSLTECVIKLKRRYELPAMEKTPVTLSFICFIPSIICPQKILSPQPYPGYYNSGEDKPVIDKEI
jgi:hypothetical protein